MLPFLFQFCHLNRLALNTQSTRPYCTEVWMLLLTFKALWKSIDDVHWWSIAPLAIYWSKQRPYIDLSRGHSWMEFNWVKRALRHQNRSINKHPHFLPPKRLLKLNCNTCWWSSYHLDKSNRWLLTQLVYCIIHIVKKNTVMPLGSFYFTEIQ